MSFLLNVWYKKGKKEKKKGLIPFTSYVYVLMKSFTFFFMIPKATRYTRYKNYRQRKGDTMQMKNKLYLQIILLINYIKEENLLVEEDLTPVKHATSQVSVRKNVSKKRQTESHLDGLISQVKVLSVFLSRSYLFIYLFSIYLSFTN